MTISRKYIVIGVIIVAVIGWWWYRQRTIDMALWNARKAGPIQFGALALDLGVDRAALESRWNKISGYPNPYSDT